MAVCAWESCHDCFWWHVAIRAFAVTCVPVIAAPVPTRCCAIRYLIHFPIAFAHVEGTIRSGSPRDADGKVVFDKVPIADTWRAMEALVDAGLVRNIGVCNFSSQLLLDVLSYAR